jgi:hypothetical protein
MTALAKARNTLNKHIPGLLQAFKIAASTKIYAGSLVAINSSGYAVPAGATAGHRVIGRADETIDNSAGANGALSVRVEQGCFKWTNSAGSAVAQSGVGAVCYVEDDNTVASSASNSIVAGIVVEVESDGIWVMTQMGMNGTALQGYPSGGAIETVAVGAIDPAVRTTLMTIDGTKAYSLANGTIEGQRKSIRVTAAINTPAGTLTPATFADGTTITGLNAVNDFVELEWHASLGWRVIDLTSVTIS